MRERLTESKQATRDAATNEKLLKLREMSSRAREKWLIAACFIVVVGVRRFQSLQIGESCLNPFLRPFSTRACGAVSALSQSETDPLLAVTQGRSSLAIAATDGTNASTYRQHMEWIDETTDT
jgi:hypothetical protein